MTNYASINPDDQPKSTSDNQNSGAFSSLVKVTKSRYDKLVYPVEMNIADRAVIVWEMLTPRGKTFDRTYSTGHNWSDVQVSSDGKHITTAFKANSDANFLIQKAIGSSFPKERITNDISVFEGACFFVQDDVNPKASGSKKKPYPKTYYPEGPDKAFAEYQAKQAARAAQNARQNNAAAPQRVTEVPKVVQLSPDVLSAAGAALTEILAACGGKVDQNDIISKLNLVAEGKGWQPSFRQEVALALWHGAGGNLQTVIASNPTLAVAGESVTFKQ